MLADAETILGDRDAVLGRELTKLHEECLRGPLSRLREHLGQRARVRGECVLLVAGGAAEGALALAPGDLDARIHALRTEGLATREIAARIAHETGRPRREIYQRVLALAGRDPRGGG
jgi:16S rRNA (cytidine1402-2'-O)-methyltransferase